MNIEIPYEIGDKIKINGELVPIKGMHIYVTNKSDVIKWRFHIGKGKFVTVDNDQPKGVTNEHKQEKPFTRSD